MGALRVFQVKIPTPRDPFGSRGVEIWEWECATLSSPITVLRRSTQWWADGSPTLFATASGNCAVSQDYPVELVE
jgi:hypothetical protein